MVGEVWVGEEGLDGIQPASRRTIRKLITRMILPISIPFSGQEGIAEVPLLVTSYRTASFLGLVVFVGQGWTRVHGGISI
jgi:hypothetical protein